MLEPLRRHSRSAVIYVLFAILIAVFALTFNTSSRMSAGGRGETTEVMASVNGTTIDNGDFSLAMRLSADAPPPGLGGFERIQASQRYEKTRLLYSGAPGEIAMLTDFDGPVPMLLAEKVMTELLAGALVAEEAGKQGLAASDAELTRRVLNLQRVFGASLLDENGNFDSKKYETFVRFTLGTSKAGLESFLRREIVRDKLAAIVTAGVALTPAELDAVVASDSKRPKLEFVAIDADAAGKTIQVSDADADAYAAAHADKIQAAYDAKGDVYKVSDKWDLRGLLIEAPAADSPAAKDPAKKAEIDKQRDEKHAAVLALRAELDKAWHGEVDLPAVATSPEAIAEAGTKKATELTGQEKTDRLAAYFGKQAGEKTEHMITKDVGGKFTGESVEALGRTPFGPNVAQAVQTAEPGQLLGPIDAPNGWWLLVVETKTPGHATPLDSVKRELAKELVAQDRAAGELDKIATSVAEAAAATPTGTLADVVKKWNQQHGGKADGPLVAAESGPIGKSPVQALSGGLEALLGMAAAEQDPNDIPGMGKLPEVAQAAWKLSAEHPLAKQVFKSEDGKSRYVVRLAKEPAEDKAATEAIAKSREALGRQVVQMRKVEAWHSYVTKLLKKAEADGRIKRSDAYASLISQEKQRLAEALKRAPVQAGPGAGGGINLKLNGKDMPLQPAGKHDAPAAP